MLARLTGKERGRLGVVTGKGRGRAFGEETSAQGEPCGAVAVGHEAEVPDAMEAGWQDMEQEAPHEFAGVERHHLVAALVAVVLPAEADLAVGEIEEPAVGDGIVRWRAFRTTRWV